MRSKKVLPLESKSMPTGAKLIPSALAASAADLASRRALISGGYMLYTEGSPSVAKQIIRVAEAEFLNNSAAAIIALPILVDPLAWRLFSMAFLILP